MDKLIKRAQNMDGEAFVELMERNKQAMYKVAKAFLKREEDVADAISETILDCFEHLQSLKEPKYFRTWLIRILINNCKDIIQKNRQLSYLGDTDFLENRPDQSDDREFIRLLEPLDEETRVVMTLYYAQGFHTREIAGLLNINESTVKSRIRRARQKIKKEFFPSIA